MNHSKDQLLALVEANPFISQQALGEALGLSRSAVAGHLAQLVKEGRILGRAYVLPSRQPLVCIGGTNLDRKLRSDEPLRMGSSNPARQMESAGGVARNLAENLARLGLPVHLLTVVGRDAAGQALLAELQALGVDCTGCVQATDVPTGSYTAVLDAQGDLLLAMADMALTDRLDPDFIRRCAPQRAAARWVVADLNLPAASLELLQQEALLRKQSLVVVAVSAPKMRRLGPLLEGIELLVLNRAELAALLDHPLDTDASLQEAWLALRERGLQRLVVSDGAHGLRFSDGNTLLSLPAPKVPRSRLREVTGAGDALTAGIVAGLHRQADDLRAACKLGLSLAALTLQTDATVSRDLSPALLA
ncbi:winged helix-turn-helix transcriptional regulator [Roseateles sp. SL47]|uniref:carbohydrate kinase n=1 Tax=Roseateles sp. SL47 TaxID=2995138 RepID=UPI00226E972B|nr:carbohydrate kinase [Roseateles sp. SL47]WAC73688.1 winged helix-turn-helix transcriptional regulator [Roseateles sp. SL47]